jgi:hypothetical protein
MHRTPQKHPISNKHLFSEMQSTSKFRNQPALSFFLSLVAGLSVLAAGCAGVPKHPTWNNATGAEQHERMMWKAIREKDWFSAERRLSATFIGVNVDGQTFDRSAWLQHWKNMRVQEFSVGEMQVLPEGPDMKLIYVFHVQGAGTAMSPSGGLRVVSVWQQVKTRWMLTATSITPIQNN